MAVKQGIDLSLDRQEEEIIYSNANSNVIFYEDITLNEKQTKKKSEVRKLTNRQWSMADLIKRWSTGD